MNPCPICGHPTTSTSAPFCSERCRLVDLGGWLDERYAIPTQDEDGGDSRLPDSNDDSDG